MDAELRKRIEQTYSQAASDMEQKFNQYMKDFARKDAVKRDMVSKGLMSDKDYAKWRKGQIMIGERWKEMRDVLAQDLTNTDKIATSIINGYLPEAYAIGHNYGTFQIERGSCINTSYTLYNHEAVERLIKDEPRLLPVTQWELNAPKDMRWNHQHVTQQITQGILQGESIPQIAKRLERVVGMDERAAIRNARTAITGAQNAGRIDAYRRAEKLGIGVEKEWLATMDNVTRDSHVDMDGEHVPLDAQFSNGMDYPGGSGPPEEVYNCRCTVIPRLTDQDYSKSDLDRWRRDEDLGDMTYDEWKDSHAGRDYSDSELFSKDAWETILYKQDEATMIEWANKFTEKISSSELSGIKRYSGSAYRSMNKYLRGMSDYVSPENSTAIEECTSALKKGYIPESCIVRRGVDTDALAAMLKDENAIQNIIDGDVERYLGAVFVDKGFVSTSPLVSGGFSDEVEMIIKVPKGAQAAYIDPISTCRGEQELLIQRSQAYYVEHLEAEMGSSGLKGFKLFCTMLGGSI